EVPPGHAFWHESARPGGDNPSPNPIPVPRSRGRGVFTGEFRHTIDGKGRVAVPARFRADLAAGATVCRWLENCVAIFPKKAWQPLADAASAERYSDASARAFTRFLFSGAFEVELDAQG